MSNIGREFPSEMETFIDKKSGLEVTQLTKTGTNVHFYFTENSFTLGDEEIIFSHKDGRVTDYTSPANLFSMDLKTGKKVQLTEFEKDFKSVYRITKSPDSKYFVFLGDGDLYCIDRVKNETRLLYRAPVGFTLGATSISYDCRYVAVIANDDITGRAVRSSDENYGGFKESFYAHKNGYIVIANMDGSGAEIVFNDTHWLGHVQFAPDTNEFITYCHEGPWNYVQQRIWMLNTVTRRAKPCFIQEEDDSVGHEFWTRDGLVFFDNRGKGHDGTITSDRTQAVALETEGTSVTPWVGFADKDCNLVRKFDLPFYCNHYHANKDNTMLVADAVDDIVLIDISTDTPTLKVLCEHNTSWRYQESHGHPCWSWSNDKILFASDRDEEGYVQIYMVKMK